jgi:hypothetical protein
MPSTSVQRELRTSRPRPASRHWPRLRRISAKSGVPADHAMPASRPVVPARLGIRSYIFGVQWLIIGLVSAIDVYLTIRYAATINELNPLGNYLMHIGGVELFMGLKMYGTILVLGALAFLYHRRKSMGLVVSTGVCMAQLALLGFLFS